MADFPSARAGTRPQIGARSSFLVATYAHLFGAIGVFTTLLVIYFQIGFADRVVALFSQVPWLIILGVYMILSWFARGVAHRTDSLPLQYAGLGFFVLIKSVIFIPLIDSAERYAPGTLETAAGMTLVGFLGLTGIAFLVRTDFSFLGATVRWGLFIGLLLIIFGAIFGFHLGMWFSLAMVALAGGAVLYDTGAILRRYSRKKYVAASLELFASIALMFWYMLRFMRQVQR